MILLIYVSLIAQEDDKKKIENRKKNSQTKAKAGNEIMEKLRVKKTFSD